MGRSPGEGNGNPLQYSCLENPVHGLNPTMDRGAWWAIVHGVAKSWTRLSDFTILSAFYSALYEKKNSLGWFLRIIRGKSNQSSEILQLYLHHILLGFGNIYIFFTAFMIDCFCIFCSKSYGGFSFSIFSFMFCSLVFLK